MPLGESLTHRVHLGLQLFQVRLEFRGPLLPIAEAPMEAVGSLLSSTTAGTMAAVMGTGVPATVVVTTIASAAARIIAATAMAAVTGTGTPATVVAFTSSAAAATAL